MCCAFPSFQLQHYSLCNITGLFILSWWKHISHWSEISSSCAVCHQGLQYHNLGFTTSLQVSYPIASQSNILKYIKLLCGHAMTTKLSNLIEIESVLVQEYQDGLWFRSRSVFFQSWHKWSLYQQMYITLAIAFSRSTKRVIKWWMRIGWLSMSASDKIGI